MKKILICLMGLIFSLVFAGCEILSDQEADQESEAQDSSEYSRSPNSDKNLNPKTEEVIAQEKELAEKNTKSSQTSEKPSPSAGRTSSDLSLRDQTSSSPEMNAETQRLMASAPENPPSETKPESSPAPATPAPESTKQETPPPAEASKSEAENKPEVKPETKPETKVAPPPESPYVGSVALAPPQKKFAVVDFRETEIPPLGSKLGVYRGGIFVGSVQITGPVRGTMATADILNGSLQKGDVVR